MRKDILMAIALSAMGCNFVQEFDLPATEKDTSCGSPSDANNCGLCKHSCLGGSCVAGKCAPVLLASGQGDSVSGVPWFPYLTDAGDPLQGADRIAVDSTHVYWLNLRGEV